MLAAMRLSALYGLWWAGAATTSVLPILDRRSNIIKPAPISVPAAEVWEGIDGQWNTFALRVGDLAQVVRVLASTASQQVWVIDPLACLYRTNKNACAESRGGVYYNNKSSTWQEEGLYDLFIEQNLNLTGTGRFGYDGVALGYLGQGGPSLVHQIVGSLATEDFWLGHFGLHPKTTNFTNLSDNVPSYLSTLRSQNMIPTVSWGYTQGAAYRFSKVPASLTLGGYDRNRFIPNDITFALAPNTDRDLLVNINTISTDLKRNSSRPDPADASSLLESPIYAFVDSTVAEIWLPQSACRRFEKAFNLDWDHKTQLYTINDAVHSQLVSSNPNISFSLAPSPGGGPTVQITFPYAAFDLMAMAPYRGLQNNTRYFPLRRALNESQYTLGRTFLQEAYLMVDWERQNFSISQVKWTPNSPQHLVGLFPPSNTTSDSANDNSLRTHPGVIAGIAVSVAVVLAIIAILSFLLWRSNRRKAREARADLKSKMEESDVKDEPKPSNLVEKAELDAGEVKTIGMHEKSAVLTPPPEPVEAPENMIFELPGDGPLEVEAGGRELSEKEAMRVREDRYNGINPNPDPTTPVRPGTGQSPISPITPHTATTTNMTDESTIISPISATSVHRTIESALSTTPRKRPVDGDQIEPIKEIEGRTTSLKHGEGEGASSQLQVAQNRDRFSWENR